MKSTGIIRRVDDLGRIVLPMELRRTLGILEHDEVEIYVDGHQIVLQKFSPRCIFCGYDEDLINYCGKCVCRMCVTNLKKS